MSFEQGWAIGLSVAAVVVFLVGLWLYSRHDDYLPVTVGSIAALVLLIAAGIVYSSGSDSVGRRECLSQPGRSWVTVINRDGETTGEHSCVTPNVSPTITQ